MKSSRQKTEPTSSWKDEVNRRIAEHKERKGGLQADQKASREIQPPDSRAALAAARVAARYAKAPSYSQMLAEEALAAVRAAEAASRDALNAQAKAQAVLAELEAVSAAQPDWEHEHRAQVPLEMELPKAVGMERPIPAMPIGSNPKPAETPADRDSFEIRWDSDLPRRDSSLATARSLRGEAAYGASSDSAWRPAMDAAPASGVDGVEVVEGAQPIPANLIKFPRELVAARKARPRRAEGPYAAMVEGQSQLSIFEVEPWNISTEPQPAAVSAGAATGRWIGPDWSGMELDEEPQQEIPYPDPPAYSHATRALSESAPLNHRILAAIVDFSLIASIFLAAGLIASTSANALPSQKFVEYGSIAVIALVAFLYHLAFFAISGVTPGMRYARLYLSTFDGREPSFKRRCFRAAALLFSVLPLGLGVCLGDLRRKPLLLARPHFQDLPPQIASLRVSPTPIARGFGRAAHSSEAAGSQALRIENRTQADLASTSA